MTLTRTALAAALLFAACSAGATVISITNQVNAGFAVSNTDLLQTELQSAVYAGFFSQEGALGTAAFNNGLYGEQGNQSNGHWYASQAATADGGNSAVFTFKRAFDLSSIATYAGWDNYRGGQSYKLFYATAAAPTTFIALANVYDNPTGGGNVNSRVRLTGDAGLLAANVLSLKFQFGGDLTYGYAGYREIDVQGQATAVPEPGSLALLGFGLAALGLRRRARK